MYLRLLTAFAMAAGSMSAVAFGQGRPPAEAPPAGFAGQQYVDSRGCLYARAGMGANENWVARIDRARKPICGQIPTRTQMAEALALLAAPDPVMAPAVPATPRAQARAAAAPAGVTAPAAPPAALQSRPVAAAAPVAVPMAAPAAPGASSTAGCPSHAPWGRYFDLRRGGRTLICSNSLERLDQLQGSAATQAAPSSATASVSPMMAMAQAIAPPVALSPSSSQAQLEAEQTARALRARLAEDEALSKPPPGYKPAWDDGRLNPMRGVRTEAGERQMERVWVPGSPMKAQPTELPPSPVLGQMPAMASITAVSGKANGGTAQGARVQVGSFADASNAQTVVARIQAMGMPVSLGRGQVRGKSVQVVSAGPFASKAEASAAQAALRGAGFTDSILR